jgi:hypothetical protein
MPSRLAYNTAVCRGILAGHLPARDIPGAEEIGSLNHQFASKFAR